MTAAASGIPGATRCWPVYVQAKRYTGRHVGRPDVQAFAGAPRAPRPAAECSSPRLVLVKTPSIVIWSCAGPFQAGLVGEDYGLDPIAQAKLGHGVSEVSLDGGLADEQGRGDLGVG